MMNEAGGLNAAKILGVNSTSGMSAGLQAVIDSDEDAAMGEAIQMDQAPKRGKVSKKSKKKNSSVPGLSGNNQVMVQRKVFNNFMDK